MNFSVRTQESFGRVLNYSLRTAASNILALGALTELKADEGLLKTEALTRIMLTVSAMNFRINFILHYKNNAQMMNFIKQSNQDDGSASANTQNHEAVDAYFLEMGNRFCGEAKRLCHDAFDFLGMSTPYVLSQITSMSDMHSSTLKTSHHVQFCTQGKAMVAGSIYVYSDDELVLDLPEATFAEQEGVGELEFF
jgi:hypothetical protein